MAKIEQFGPEKTKKKKSEKKMNLPKSNEWDGPKFLPGKKNTIPLLQVFINGILGIVVYSK